MQAVRSRDTLPELRVRRLVHAAGLRYRVAARPLPSVRRTADMVFRPTRVAVFIDGCFWHGCLDHSRPPKTNTPYWTKKIERNVERDRQTNTILVAEGWLVMRHWEHEDPVAVADMIIRTVTRRRRKLL